MDFVRSSGTRAIRETLKVSSTTNAEQLNKTLISRPKVQLHRDKIF